MPVVADLLISQLLLACDTPAAWTSALVVSAAAGPIPSGSWPWS